MNGKKVFAQGEYPGLDLVYGWNTPIWFIQLGVPMSDPNIPSTPEQPAQQPAGQQPATSPVPPQAPPAPPQASPAAPAPTAPSGSKGMAVTALILGIVAIVGSPIPFLNFGSPAFGIVALILGIIVVMKKKPGKGMGMTGLILGAVSIVLSVILGIVYSIGFLALLGDSEVTTDTTISEEQTDETTADDTTTELEVPAGFQSLDTGVAYRFAEAECLKYDLCVPVEIYALVDCRAGIDVYANEIDYDTENVFGQTSESAGPLLAGDTAVLELPIVTAGANAALITDIQCFQ